MVKERGAIASMYIIRARFREQFDFSIFLGNKIKQTLIQSVFFLAHESVAISTNATEIEMGKKLIAFLSSIH